METMLKRYMNYVKGNESSFLFDVIFIPLAYLMSATISIMDFLRAHGLLKTEEPPLPLISVGNITYGGTNKTPFVKMLAEFALSRGIKAGIVTRGYSGKSDDVIIIKNGQGERALTGDEPLLLSRDLPEIPIAIAKHRIEGVKALKNLGVELVIADDAFQHRSMRRDSDIVLIDCLCPFGSEKLIPAGMMRESLKALSRADIVVLTKSEQISTAELENLRARISEYISPDQIFTSTMDHDEWILLNTTNKPEIGDKVFAFSAIGSPESFISKLNELGLNVIGSKNFRDHHTYSNKDLAKLNEIAKSNQADFMTCTEKDLYNFPEIAQWKLDMPLAVPRVKAVINESEKFFTSLIDSLQPQIVVASNGFGEDAIGVILAKKLRAKLTHSKVYAFPLVGRGDAYIKEGFIVKSAPSVTPSGGVLKYSVKDLWGDMRAGLLKHVRAQLEDWRKIAIKMKTPVCIGDVYLLLHTLFGSGARPLFAATAKTVYLSGHWKLERAIINKFTLRTWTRDSRSAIQLGKRAVYSGSPIMDLLLENENFHYERGDVLLLLPGSRERAFRDVKLLLDTAEILGNREIYRMILAPTLDYEKFFAVCESYGWEKVNDTLTKNQITISISYESIAKSVDGVKILLGLGGTANQVCAGLGIPVISIDEKGKRVQKKLLGDAEILVHDATPETLAETVKRVLNDKTLYDFMSNAGRERMGNPGAVDDIMNYACGKFGWDVKDNVYEKLREKQNPPSS